MESDKLHTIKTTSPSLLRRSIRRIVLLMCVTGTLFSYAEAGETYRFGRDEIGRIISETGFDGLTRRYTRNVVGNVSRVERPGERFSEFSYDVRGRLRRVDYHDGSFESYSYNKDGLLVQAENDNSLLKIKRDAQGRITEEWQDGHLVQSKYDERGQRLSLTSSLGANLSMGYTESGLLRDMKAEAWEMALKYDQRGLEVERSLTGAVVSRSEYDIAGRIERQRVYTARGSDTRRVRYKWGLNDRLVGITNELTKKDTWFDYDTMGNLVGASYNNMTERLFRVPDAVGNLYKTADRKDRIYGPGGRLLEAEGTRYEYDEEGNMTEKIESGGKKWLYEWNANGSLKTVTRPDRQKVGFEYDAIGRRTAKIFDKRITRWVWDGNTPLHEWSYPLDERPKTVFDEFGMNSKEGEEPITNLITWVFEEGTFKPVAKLTEMGYGNMSIITDHLGTPVQMYGNIGNRTWAAEFDIYGKNRTFEWGSLTDCPFRFQGQYEDAETGLYYNRFRYYSPDEGMYLSQDPIGLAGNNPTLYGYVHDPNGWLDAFGLDCIKAKSRNEALRMAKEHAQVHRASKGGQTIGMDDLNPTSRGSNWARMKAGGGKKLGMTNPNGKNKWVEHPDGHPDAGQPNIPSHHYSGHVHSINPQGEEKIFKW